MDSFTVSGKWAKTERFLNEAAEGKNIDHILNHYGQIGVDVLSNNTPKLTGLTASSWGYEIEKTQGKTSIVFTNSNINRGVNIAIILQYGHGTRNGGYVEGIDYINPALQPIFNQIVDDIWKEVNG